MKTTISGDAVEFDPSFDEALKRLEEYLAQWDDGLRVNLEKAHREIGLRHKAEAAKRVPVEDGRLKNGLITNVYSTPTEITTETGTNVVYGVFTELGTKYIAKGNVKALGTGPIITDAQAIKVWPAKNKDRIADDGTAHATAIDEYDRRSRGTGVGEQMPWLRSAWAAIRIWALQKLLDAVAPPPKGP